MSEQSQELDGLLNPYDGMEVTFDESAVTSTFLKLEISNVCLFEVGK